MRATFYKGASADSRHIREIVFIEEQGFEEEFDSYDDYVDTLVIYDDNDVPMATGRLYEIDHDRHIYKLGRIAVMKEYRMLGLGRMVLRDMEEFARLKGAKEFYISAQVVAMPFYKKCGYEPYGDTYYEEHVQHISMKKAVQ